MRTIKWLINIKILNLKLDEIKLGTKFRVFYLLINLYIHLVICIMNYYVMHEIDDLKLDIADSELELGSTSIIAPLSHSAARHKMAVRPKRTHGAPRRRRVQQVNNLFQF